MFLLLALGQSYSKSVFGHHGTDSVMIRDPDSLQPLEEIEKPNPPHIREAKYTDPIEDNQYPWPGHKRTADIEKLRNETQKIFNNFCKGYNKLEQSKAYRHPAGIKQFNGNETWINNATRHKYRFLINNKRMGYHPTGIYVPPGEVISIDIPGNTIKRIVVQFNHHTHDQNNYNTRLGRLKCRFTLNSQHTEFAWPYGGNLDLVTYQDEFPLGFEVNISGGIRMPHFIYGVNTDEEWETDLRKLAAPLTTFDTGTFLARMPTHNIRGAVCVNDGMRFWQTVSWNSYDVNEVTSVNRRDGNVIRPLFYNFDSYVPAGAAVAFVGGNFIQAPPSWAGGIVNYDSAKWGCWGLLHEYHHHFQSGWGFANPGEVTNNVLNLIDMVLICEIDSTRQVNFNGDYVGNKDGWNRMSYQYNTINNGDLLSFYGNNVYYFGSELQRKCLKEHITQKHYKRNEVGGYVSEFLLTCAKVFKRDMRAYFSRFSFVNMQTMVSEFCNQTLDQMRRENKIKEFHPLATIYGTGYVLDGYEFETAKPFRIAAGAPYYFDFQKYMRSKNGMHTFSFKSCRATKGTLTQISGARYKFVPGDRKELSKIYVEYKDNVNNDITTVVISVKQYPKGLTTTFYKLASNSDMISAYNEFMANREKSGHSMIHEMRIGVPLYSGHQNQVPWVALSEGTYFPDKSGETKFIFEHDEDILLWMSENSLTGDLEEDKEHLIVNLTGYSGTANPSQNTKYINLEKDKKYYWRLFLKNAAGGGKANGFYMIKNDTTKYNIQPNRVRQYNAESLSEPDHHPFIPKFRDNPYQDNYIGSDFAIMPKGYVTVVSHPTLHNSSIDLNDFLFDGLTDDKGETNIVKNGTGQTFYYEIELKNETRCSGIHFFTNKGKAFVGHLKITSIDESGTNTTMQNGNVNFNSQNFFAYRDSSKKINPKPIKKISIAMKPNKDNNFQGISEFTFYGEFFYKNQRKIIPATHTLFAKQNGSVILTRYGLYYNGRGLKLKKDGRVDIKLGQFQQGSNTLGIVGDKDPYNEGKFDVYIDEEYYGTVNTQHMYPAEFNKLSGSKAYQLPLVGYSILRNPRNEATTAPKDITVSLRCTAGTVGIAGLIGNYTVKPVDGFDYQKNKIQYDKSTENSMLEEGDLRSDDNEDTNNYNESSYGEPVFVEEGPATKEPKTKPSQPDNAPNESGYSPSQTINGKDNQIAKSDNKVPAIAGGIVAALVVVALVVVGVIFYMKQHPKLTLSDELDNEAALAV
ncbi:Immuno-dominant variable surface antigen-like [Trichomonas vaginalis G3]|uniref:Immuno-dominant variable surface antigen-like n=1 Tax=Trichomonas vaginalis (strain ATCC PRA-98 / G3) TaxID=412133 RepID=A2F335_TRIV3|nr:experimental autoimmune prostatitis antigen 2-related family [Trichomonas vaginalis G3]EAY00699.1 Immuno-dominant variable surface antigen-like [Trichomonas vaginalis G3]KAI5513273.1 experimental autoimmune prostatitis antigen 2-related family [Trichomonas vaginalis G3]|eukprot:XP_001313628.1 Immuno-dominant variable surface antigen-like [Trichomonas vaginalis G3]